jgi:hypothetical protein
MQFYFAKNVHFIPHLLMSDSSHTLVIYAKDALTYGKQCTQNDKIFFGKKLYQLWINACFGDHLHGGGDGLRNVGLLSTTDTACCLRRFY